MECIIEAHLLAARHLLARGDTQAALGEAETGLLHAVACGYGLLRIELLVALARIRLAWPDPPESHPGRAGGARPRGPSRLRLRLGRSRRGTGLGRGLLRQPRARARSTRVHPRARGAQAHRTPGRRRNRAMARPNELTRKTTDRAPRSTASRRLPPHTRADSAGSARRRDCAPSVVCPSSTCASS